MKLVSIAREKLASTVFHKRKGAKAVVLQLEKPIKMRKGS